MNFNEKQSISEYLLANPHVLEIFEKNEIDYYSGGKDSFRSYFSKKCFSGDQKIKFINLLTSAEVNLNGNKEELKVNPNYNSLKDLCNYISNHHHKYSLATIQKIKEEFGKLSIIERLQTQEVLEVKKLAEKLYTEIKIHLNKEETVLFPLIRYLEECKKFAEKPHLGKNRPMSKSLEVLESDHTLSTQVIKKIIETLKVIKRKNKEIVLLKQLLSKVVEMENDLHIHIHLENNILFPKALELENYLYKTYQR